MLKCVSEQTQLLKTKKNLVCCFLTAPVTTMPTLRIGIEIDNISLVLTFLYLLISLILIEASEAYYSDSLNNLELVLNSSGS